MLTRRHFLLTAAAAATMLPAWRVWAASTLTLGELTIDTLSDGNLVLPPSFIFTGMPDAEVAALMARHNLGTGVLTPPCNVTLLRDGVNTILMDAGAGPDFQPSAGRLLDALAALDVTPDQVTHVIVTHAHPDHLWGVLDEFDEPVFANARHVMGEREHAYWLDPGTVDTIGAERTTFAVGAARRLDILGDTMNLIGDGDSPVAGLTARLSPGHTPGHLAFEVSSAGQSVLVAGDAIGNHHIAFEDPARLTGSDQDPALAAETRAGLLNRAVEEAMPIIGYHLPDGGIGAVERIGNAFRFVPGAA